MGFLAGSADALALDAAVAPRLGVNDLLTVERARARGILPEFAAVGDVPEVRAIKLPDPPTVANSWGLTLPPVLRHAMRQYLISRPKLDPAKCVGCGLCAKMCPPQSLRIVGGKAKFRLANCIRCYCCQEHCPKGAITPIRPWTMRAAGKLDRALHKLLRRP